LDLSAIDVHTHIYPKLYLRELEKIGAFDPSKSVLKYGGVIVGHVKIPDHTDLEAKIKFMDRVGIEAQVLSLTTPGVDVFEKEQAIKMAKAVNDELAEAMRKYPQKIFPLCVLPLHDVESALEELDRAIKDLGLYGWIAFSNFRGKLLGEPEFHPLFERAAKLKVPVLIHPQLPVITEALIKARMPVQTVGFIYDTSLCVLSLIFNGVLEKSPELRLIHVHAGGLIPYMIGRVDVGYERYFKERGEFVTPIAKPPSTYYKEQVYVDTINMFLPALYCAYELVGPSKMLVGTDYPHIASGRPEDLLANVDRMPIPPREKLMIKRENVIQLFKLKL
jgi:predicted TIM-barrel fold metal-dependent hydrolase